MAEAFVANFEGVPFLDDTLDGDLEKDLYDPLVAFSVFLNLDIYLLSEPE